MLNFDSQRPVVWELFLPLGKVNIKYRHMLSHEIFTIYLGWNNSDSLIYFNGTKSCFFRILGVWFIPSDEIKQRIRFEWIFIGELKE